jgi:V/A-type H+-transporting ATPase subunit E
MREKNDYRSLFTRLLSESVEEMGEDTIVLHVDPRDEALCREVVSQMKGNYTIIPDITTWGGVIASSPDDQVRIHNTLESRLERAKILTKKEVCRILFGE